jgi:Xaa-Pro dipeptidase
MVEVSFRVKQAQQAIRNSGLDCLLLRSRQNVKYFTGFDFEGGVYVLIPKEGKPTVLTSLLDEFGHKAFQSFRYRDEEGLRTKIAKEAGKRLGVEHDFWFSTYAFFKGRMRGVDFVDASDMITGLRKIKTAAEIAKIRKAVKITEDAMQHGLARLSSKMTESSLAKIIKTRMVELGADVSFCLVQSGKNSAIPHKHPTHDVIKDSLLLDAGAKFEGYNADISRTFLLKKSKEAAHAYSTVVDAQRAGSDSFAPGKEARHIHRSVETILREAGFKFIHSTGHGIGLDVHEAPSISSKSKERFENGMVFTIEPGVYVKGKFGVRIEDDFAVVGKKLLKLSSFPVESYD